MLYSKPMASVKGKLSHRQRQAQFTQQLILDAARELFLSQGYGATTIEAIAEKAGVAVSTVYAIYANKRGILKAIREAWHQESGQRDIYRTAAQSSDPQRRLELAAHATRRQWETGAAMQTIYIGAATTDQEAAAELKQALAGRRNSLGRFIDEMRPYLCPDLSPERAIAIFLGLTHAEIYRELIEEHHWTPDEYERWLAELLKQQLLPSP